MQSGGLNFAQAPPFSVPLRFFVTAPAFAVLAGLVALWHGPEVFASRWSPAALAVTHLLTLGVAAMVMLGALLQLLPVLAGAPVVSPHRVALAVHAGLGLGTLALAGGFLLASPGLLKAAVALLGVAFAAFLAAMAWSLARAGISSVPARQLTLAGLALAVTAVLGLWLAASRGWGLALPSAVLRDLHPGWGFLGWTGLLVAAVASRVVPMFQMTPPYPAWLSVRFGLAVLAALAAWSLAWWHGGGAPALAATAVLAALYAAFAAATLWLQHRRRRRLPDVSLLFWRTGMLCAILAALGWSACSLAGAPPEGAAVILGVLTIGGATLSVIFGMLYKIVPFLAWLHLQAKTGLGRHVPHVRQYLSEERQRRHLWLHLAALAMLLAAAAEPQALARPAAIVFAVSALQLLLNLMAIVGVYRRPPAMADLSRSG